MGVHSADNLTVGLSCDACAVYFDETGALAFNLVNFDFKFALVSRG